MSTYVTGIDMGRRPSSTVVQLVIGQRLFVWDSDTRRWRCCGRFVKSPLTPKGERKLLGRHAR